MDARAYQAAFDAARQRRARLVLLENVQELVDDDSDGMKHGVYTELRLYAASKGYTEVRVIRLSHGQCGGSTGRKRVFPLFADSKQLIGSSREVSKAAGFCNDKWTAVAPWVKPAHLISEKDWDEPEELTPRYQRAPAAVPPRTQEGNALPALQMRWGGRRPIQRGMLAELINSSRSTENR